MRRKDIDPEKLKDMIRSILPSKNREAARDSKAIRKREHRRKVRAELRHEVAEETAANFLRDVAVGDLVSWRRSGDKLNHFIRWCEAITAGMSMEDADGYVRSILPKSLIGEHAYSHWELSLRRARRRHLSYREREGREIQSYTDSMVFRLLRALALDPGLHAHLNAEIKSRKQAGEPRRLLLGLHDVEEFIETIRPPNEVFAVERAVTIHVIAENEKGGRKAALRFSLFATSSCLHLCYVPRSNERNSLCARYDSASRRY